LDKNGAEFLFGPFFVCIRFEMYACAVLSVLTAAKKNIRKRFRQRRIIHLR
jgi:hypothetical protein